MSISTRRGDSGTTDLADGSRLGKDSLRVECLGELDELIAFLGLARSLTDRGQLIEGLQKDLSALAASLALPGYQGGEVLASALKNIEKLIAELETGLPPLTSFIMPGSSLQDAAFHVCRTVCRRLERWLVSLDRAEGIEAEILSYINRLSDLLFLLARKAGDCPKR
ncbi:MAG: cob(I)yrinic acid a,c-diamide adenosyltransferase [Treponema sp.]|nr:cob(I)yrinic acid a,c-diamide adenosyltransferase [Treponema sp.]